MNGSSTELEFVRLAVTPEQVPCSGSRHHGPFRLRIEMLAERRELPDVWLRAYNIGGQDLGDVRGAGTRDWGRRETRWHSQRNRAVKLAMRSAHLRPPSKVCDFEWKRIL